MNSCPHCDAPLKPAATFCLACDQPVVPETSRLSVGEAVPTKVGRPVVGLLVAAVCVLAVGGAAYGGIAYIHHQRTSSQSAVVTDIKRGTTLLVEAEGGSTSACRRTARIIAGTPADVIRECRTVIGDDSGAHLDSIKVDRLDLQGPKGTGTARVRATVTDDKGKHSIDRTVHLIHAARAWRLAWDGKSIV